MSIVGGLLNFAGSTIGSAINSYASYKTTLLNNQFARENAQEQRDWQEKMYKQQQMYNTPANQAKLMRDAGLNPYEGVGFQPLGSAGTGAVAETIPFENPVSSVMNMMLQQAQLKSIELDNEAKELENENKRVGVDFAKATYEQRVQMVGEQLNDLKLDNQQTSQIVNLIQDAYFDTEGNVKDNPHKLDYEIKQQQKDLNEFAKQLESNKAIQSNFVNYVKATFGIDYTFLPDDLKQQVSQWVFSSLNGATDNDSVLNNLWERLAIYAHDSENARQRQAYGDTWIGELRKLIDDLKKMCSDFDISPSAFLAEIVKNIWN